MNLSRREVFSFSLARKMLNAFEGTPLEMDMRSTLDKIAASLEGTFAVSLDALTEHMSVQAEDRVVIDPAIWEAVARAICLHTKSAAGEGMEKIENFVIYPTKGVGFMGMFSSRLGMPFLADLSANDKTFPFGSAAVLRLKEYKE